MLELLDRSGDVLFLLVHHHLLLGVLVVLELQLAEHLGVLFALHLCLSEPLLDQLVFPDEYLLLLVNGGQRPEVKLLLHRFDIHDLVDHFLLEEARRACHLGVLLFHEDVYLELFAAFRFLEGVEVPELLVQLLQLLLLLLPDADQLVVLLHHESLSVAQVAHRQALED